MMRIRAKHPGKCNKCGGPIVRNQWIMWEKGSGAEHAFCPGSPWFLDAFRTGKSETWISNHTDKVDVGRGIIAEGRQLGVVEGREITEIEPGIWEMKLPKDIILRAYLPELVITSRMAWEYKPDDWVVRAFNAIVVRPLKAECGIPGSYGRMRLPGDNP